MKNTNLFHQAITDLQAICHNVHTFFMEPVSPYPMAAFRILFGVYLLVNYLSMLPYIDITISGRGIYFPYFFQTFSSMPLVLSWLLYLVTLLLIGLLILGVKTRIATPALLVIYIMFYYLSITTPQQIIILVLFLLCFADLDLVWSLRPSSPPDANPDNLLRPAWVQRLLCLQICWLYFGCGFYKLFNPLWHEGSIILNHFLSVWATPLAFAVARLQIPMYVYDCIAAGTLIFELFAGALLWYRPTQKWAMLMGTSFHIMVLLFLWIPGFLICPLFYVLFLSPLQVKKWGNWLSKKYHHLVNYLDHSLQP